MKRFWSEPTINEQFGALCAAVRELGYEAVKAWNSDGSFKVVLMPRKQMP
jgi:hypothetical protein